MLAGVFTVFALCSAWFLLATGSAEATAVGVRLTTRAGRYYIAWDEVAELATDGQTVVLSGPGKRLPLVPLYYYRQPERERLRLLAAIQESAERRHIPVRVDGWASCRLPTNVRRAGR